MVPVNLDDTEMSSKGFSKNKAESQPYVATVPAPVRPSFCSAACLDLMLWNRRDRTGAPTWISKSLMQSVKGPAM